MKNIILILIALLLISGCGFKQPKITQKEKEFKSPIQNKTFFTDAFAKLDKLMKLFEAPRIRIQIKSIENRTSSTKLPFDIRNFLETPLILYISSFDLVAYEPTFREKEMVMTGQRSQGIEKFLPGLVINGAITQYDKGIYSTRKGLNTDVEAGKGQGSTTFMGELDNSVARSQIAIDLKVYKYYDRTYLFGIATQNKIELLKYSRDGNFGLFLNGTGLGLSKAITFEHTEDQALRILSEYSVLQLLGRLYALPYWKCTKPNLQIDNFVVEGELKEYTNFSIKKKINKLEIILSAYKMTSFKKDGNIDNQELKEIKEKFNVEDNEILSPEFYKTLFINAPFFN